MDLVPGTYDHFKNWFHKHSYFAKAISYCSFGKVFLKCISCSFESSIAANGQYWNIGNFKRHLKDSPDCDREVVNQIPEASISMVTSENVSMTLDLWTLFMFN